MTNDATTLDDLVTRTREFIRAEVLEIDDRYDGDFEAAGGDELRKRLQALAAKAGLLAVHAPIDCGGLGLGMVDRAAVFEEATRCSVRRLST